MRVTVGWVGRKRVGLQEGSRTESHGEGMLYPWAVPVSTSWM